MCCLRDVWFIFSLSPPLSAIRLPSSHCPPHPHSPTHQTPAPAPDPAAEGRSHQQAARPHKPDHLCHSSRRFPAEQPRSKAQPVREQDAWPPSTPSVRKQLQTQAQGLETADTHTPTYTLYAHKELCSSLLHIPASLHTLRQNCGTLW